MPRAGEGGRTRNIILTSAAISFSSSDVNATPSMLRKAIRFRLWHVAHTPRYTWYPRRILRGTTVITAPGVYRHIAEYNGITCWHRSCS